MNGIDRSAGSHEDFQFAIAEERGVIEGFQDRGISVFQCRVFADERDRHFVELPFESMREERTLI